MNKVSIIINGKVKKLMSKRMKEFLAMASMTMALASVGESPAKMPRKTKRGLTNKEKKKCKSCVYC